MPSRHTPLLYRLRRVAGFSLVEVTLAVALTATVALALLGLVPVGMDGMRTSATAAAHTRILQTVAGHCQMLDWALLTSPEYNSKVYAFDYQGGELPEPANKDTVYLARTKVEPMQYLPGSTEGNSRLRTVRVSIITSNSVADFDTARDHSYSTCIAQMDDTP